LFGEVDGAVLAAGAAEGDHEVFEAALLVSAHSGIHEREDAGEELVDTFLLLEVLDDGGVFAGEGFEAFFAAGVGEAAAVENKAAAVAGFVFWQALMEGKTEDADDEIVGFGSDGLQFFRGQHALEGAREHGESDGEFDVMEEPAEVFERVGDALEEVGLAFVEAAEAVGAKGLHDADVDVGIKVLEEDGAVQRDETFEVVEIMIEELLAKFRGQVGFGVVEERGDVVLESALAAALVVDEEGSAVAEEDIAGLEVAVEEVVAGGTEEEIGKAAEIVFEGAFVEGNAGEAEEIVFEVVEIPGDGLAVEAGVGVADGIV